MEEVFIFKSFVKNNSDQMIDCTIEGRNLEFTILNIPPKSARKFPDEIKDPKIKNIVKHDNFKVGVYNTNHSFYKTCFGDKKLVCSNGFLSYFSDEKSSETKASCSLLINDTSINGYLIDNDSLMYFSIEYQSSSSYAKARLFKCQYEVEEFIGKYSNEYGTFSFNFAAADDTSFAKLSLSFKESECKEIEEEKKKSISGYYSCGFDNSYIDLKLNVIDYGFFEAEGKINSNNSLATGVFVKEVFIMIVNNHSKDQIFYCKVNEKGVFKGFLYNDDESPKPLTIKERSEEEKK